MVDALFADPRLAPLYDAVEGDRPDLDVYVAIIEEFSALSVLDIGCGTGTLACVLAQRGIELTALDRVPASLAVAAPKPGADRVSWITGDVSALPPLTVDMVTMTGNVAQVFLTEESWMSALAAARACLKPGGLLVFEARDPAKEAWRAWTRHATQRAVQVVGIGRVLHWVQVTEVAPPLVSFRQTFVLHADDLTLTSDSTLRFRTKPSSHRRSTPAGSPSRTSGTHPTGRVWRWCLSAAGGSHELGRHLAARAATTSTACRVPRSGALRAVRQPVDGFLPILLRGSTVEPLTGVCLGLTSGSAGVPWPQRWGGVEGDVEASPGSGPFECLDGSGLAVPAKQQSGLAAEVACFGGSAVRKRHDGASGEVETCFDHAVVSERDPQP